MSKTRGEMRILGAKGDTKISWDKDNEVEVENARRTFDELMGKERFAAFKMKGRDGKGEQITEFDPDAERLILVPPMAGG